MPVNRHFWQGMHVDWSGEIIDISAPPDGRAVVFTDWRCGTAIAIDEHAGTLLFNKTGELHDYAAVASYQVQGRLTYRDGGLVLISSRLNRTSDWKTGADFEHYMERRFTSIQSTMKQR